MPKKKTMKEYRITAVTTVQAYTKKDAKQAFFEDPQGGGTDLKVIEIEDLGPAEDDEKEEG